MSTSDATCGPFDGTADECPACGGGHYRTCRPYSPKWGFAFPYTSHMKLFTYWRCTTTTDEDGNTTKVRAEPQQIVAETIGRICGRAVRDLTDEEFAAWEAKTLTFEYCSQAIVGQCCE